MTEHHINWQKAAGDALSYRRMYALAVEIVASDSASCDLQRSAAKVVRALTDVIEKPIADAKILSKARRKFQKLERALMKPGSV